MPTIATATTRLLPLLLMLLLQPVAAAEPYRVVRSISIDNGNWYPLSVEQMKAAAGDTALTELTSAGLLQLIDTPTAGSGRLALRLSLLGSAETAKLTIQLDLPDRASQVASASISVRGLDYQGIYDAFEHIGTTAGSRLSGRLRGDDDLPALHGDGREEDDTTLQYRYDEAQRQKRLYEYDEAQALFEQVATASGPGSERLARLAEDELRYALPLFEAKQRLVGMGQPGRELAAIDHSMVRADNLFRQLLAENRGDIRRVQEAQHYLDEIAVSRNALRNARRASAMARAGSLRVMVMEHLAIYGECPDRQALEQLLQQLHSAPELTGISGSDNDRRMELRDPQSDTPMQLRCDPQGVRFDLG